MWVQLAPSFKLLLFRLLQVVVVIMHTVEYPNKRYIGTSHCREVENIILVLWKTEHLEASFIERLFLLCPIGSTNGELEIPLPLCMYNYIETACNKRTEPIDICHLQLHVHVHVAYTYNDIHCIPGVIVALETVLLLFKPNKGLIIQ